MKFKATLIAASVAANLAGTAHGATFQRVPDSTGNVYIRIVGELMIGDLVRMGEWTKTMPANDQIIGFMFNSPGGNILEGARFATMIHDMRVSTYVSDDQVCASACFLMWAAGSHRMVAPTASLGIHSASDYNDNETIDAMGVTLGTIRMLKTYGVPDAVLGRLATTKPGEMVWLHPKDLTAMNVETVESLAVTTSSPAPPTTTATPMDGATQAFTQGRVDRQAYEIWITSLPQGSQTKDGALYWASVRSTTKAKLGSTGPGHIGTPEQQQWANGCQLAKNMLDPTDYRRTHDTNYRAGWNSIP